MNPAAPYTSSTEHLLAEVARVDLLLAVHTLANSDPTRTQRATSTEERIHALLDRAHTRPPEPSAAVLATHIEADRLAREIKQRCAETLRTGLPLRLVLLAERFGLERVDVDLLLATLAPEIPSTSSTTRSTLGVLLAALLPSTEAQIAGRRRLSPEAPLLHHRLVSLDDDPTTARRPLITKTLGMDPRITSFLLGDDAVDSRISPYVHLPKPNGSLHTSLLPTELLENVERLVAKDPAAVVTLVGPPGVGKRSFVAAVNANMGKPVLNVDCGALFAAGEETLTRLLPLIAREAQLVDAAVHWTDAQAMLTGSRNAATALFTALRRHPGLTFVSSTTPFSTSLGDRQTLHLELPKPNAAEQTRLWTAALGDENAKDIDLPLLTSTFRLTAGQIFEAAKAANNKHFSNRTREPDTTVTTADIAAACRDLQGKRIGLLAKAITPRYGWDDLVLPADKKALLRELCLHLKHRSRVLEDWHYEQKLGLGKGLAALLSGPPGTGKTMAASVIAAELGVTLLHIDLSTVVSKYIGETEKHLAELFDAAEAAGAALLFDEADALFGKRTEVRDAHDRYANQETSYLLQRIESYEGIVLCSTNFMKNIDDAFVRRFAFVVELGLPNMADRMRIWEGIFTPQTPLDPDINVQHLAERIELSGGYIRNIALAAVFLAAAEGTPVAMRHLKHATRREFQKMGKVVDTGFFDGPR